MNLARLFMLGNLSANVILPDDLPKWLKKIPKAQRKFAWGEYQSKLKAKEWEEHRQREMEEEGKPQLPEKLPEWIERLPEYLRKEAWGWHLYQLKTKSWEELKRQEKELKDRELKASVWLRSHPSPPEPEFFKTKEQKEDEEKLQTGATLHRLFRAIPEEKHAKEIMEEFAKRFNETNTLLELAESRIVEADSLDKAQAALDTVEGAGNSFNGMKSILQVFGSIFSKEIAEKQKDVIDSLSERFKEINTFAHSQKLRQSFKTIEPMQKLIHTASRRIIDGDLDPSAFHFLKSAADRISKVANSILTNPNASIQEQNSAKETINLAESLKLLINTAATEFIREVKPATPQLSFPERFQQKKNAQLLSASVDALNESYSHIAQDLDQQEKINSLKLLINSTNMVLSARNVDLSIIPILEESVNKSIPVMKSIASMHLLSKVGKSGLEKVQDEALMTFRALRTFIQLAKESRVSAR